MDKPDFEVVKGDVFQINYTHMRMGWVGCLVIVNEPKAFGIQGVILYPKNHGQQAEVYINLEWKDLDYIGRSKMLS